MDTIPLFFSQYDMFSGKFQSAHFVLYRNVRLCRIYLTIQIYFIKSSGNSAPWYFNAKVSISSFRDISCCCKSILFWSFTNPLPIHLSSLAVVFLRLPGGFLAWHDSVSSSFLKMLWITLLYFPIVSPIECLSSLCNLTISFLSSNNVTDFFAIFTMQELE